MSDGILLVRRKISRIYNFVFLPSFTQKTEDAVRREKNIEEAKKIVIKMDPLLPEAKHVNIQIIQ